MVWIEFAICALVIMFAGARLSKYGDIIADLTGMGRSWIGVVLVASVTSLPELITGFSSVLLHDLPDIAAGDVFGSCMFNIAIIAFLDVMGDKPILSQGDNSHTISGGLGIVFLALAAVAILAGDQFPTLGWFGLYSPILLAGYLLAMKLLFNIQKRDQAESEESGDSHGISKTRAFVIYGINALIVIAAASWLPRLGEQIADKTGLEQSFVGTLFIALSTSLPEIVVTYAALRRGAIDLALGNLFGSNLFNVSILALEDIAYREAALLSIINRSHAATACGAIMMTAVALVGLNYKGKTRRRFGGASTALILVFIGGTLMSYILGGSQ